MAAPGGSSAVAGGTEDASEDRRADGAAAGPALRAAIPTVYGYLLHRCGSVVVAEDLTQETMLAAVAALRSGTADAAQTRWLVGVARHKLVDHYRRHGREQTRLRRLIATVPAADTATGPGDDLVDRAGAALLRLPPTQRLALVLRYMDDLPVAETARLLDRSVRATESLLARARQNLRRLYEEEGDLDG